MIRLHILSICPLSAAQMARLRERGTVFYYDAVLNDDDLPTKCFGADILITTPRLHVNIVPYLDKCQLISVQGTGTDAIDLTAATAKRIAVCNVPAFSTQAVAEHAFALMLAAARGVFLGRAILHDGSWRTGLAHEVGGLWGKTLGIFGFGKIGVRVSEIGRAFGMKVIATAKNPSPERAAAHGVDFVSFERLVADSDFLVLAAPLNSSTRGIFDAQQFAKMKRSAIFVNVSRGQLVDELALANALNRGEIAAAAQDVFVEEPPPIDHPLLRLPNFFGTPHVAWGTQEAIKTLLDEAIANVECFLNGKPRNVVNPEVLAARFRTER